MKIPADRSRFGLFLLGAVFILSLIGSSSQSRTTLPRYTASNGVDLALVLAVDCSYSVDSVEYKLQMEGLARAFRDPEVIAAIASGPKRRIAISVVQWSDANSQVVVVPWTILSGETSATSLSSRIAQVRRQTNAGRTSITTMIKKGSEMLSHLPFFAERKVIDISADGYNNNGGDPFPVRNIVVASGITINGLVVTNESITLDKYFKIYITGGPGHFVMVANDYQSYGIAIRRKLILEILGTNLV